MTQISNLESWKQAVHSADVPVSGSDEAGIARARSEMSVKPELVDLSAYRVVEVQGSEAGQFLQAQFCNDFSDITPAQAQLTGYCNPKGRLLALLLASASQSGYFLLVPASLCDGFVKRLSMYVLRADVQISLREELVCTGIVAGADGSIGDALSDLREMPAEILSSMAQQDAQLIRWYDDTRGETVRARYLRIAPLGDQLKLWSNGEDYERVSDAGWRLADIRAGLPSLTQATSEAFVPQMLNMQKINALSFTKGCYPGQEIVARMQYLGKLKRFMQMYRFTAADALPQPGDTLVEASDSDAGTVISSVVDENGRGSLLAVVKVAVAEQALTVNGIALDRGVLPYPLSDEATNSQASA